MGLGKQKARENARCGGSGCKGHVFLKKIKKKFVIKPGFDTLNNINKFIEKIGRQTFT